MLNPYPGHRLLGFDGVKLNAGILFEGGVMLGEAVGISEGVSGQGVVARTQELISLSQPVPRLPGPSRLALRFQLNEALQVPSAIPRLKGFRKEFQVAFPVTNHPVIVHDDVPDDFACGKDLAYQNINTNNNPESSHSTWAKKWRGGIFLPLE